MKILSDYERQEILKKRGKSPGNIFWENYLNTHNKRLDRIGESIKFSRYGIPPKDGLSVCNKTLAPPYKSYPKLKGLSVFEIVNGFEVYPMGYSEDFFKRPRFLGEGIICGWGTDGEPLVTDFRIF